jgi:bisanhydrobacterioruberin hydratase
MLTKKEKWISFELIVIYLVGIIGIILPLHPDFIRLTPLNLLVSIALMLWNHGRFTPKEIVGLVLVFVLGFLAEAHGTNYGVIFGEYQYGDVLGWQVWNTPLSAGLLWLIVTYGAGATMNLLFPSWHSIVKTIVGAAFLVLLDALIEPVAIAQQFWQWEGGVVPLRNYFGWFWIGVLQLLVFQYFMKGNQNKIGALLLAIQFLFFAVLNIFQ